MPGKHAKYSPSKLPRIIRCVGSILATEGLQDTDTSYAEEGTMLHEVTEKAIPHGGSLSQVLVDQYKLDQGQIDAVNDVLDYVTTLKMAHEGPYQEYIESHVSLESYVETTGCPGLKDVAGTLDYSIAFPKERILYIVDWKYGVMEVFPDTPQIKAYGAGMLGSLGGQNFYMNCQLYDTIMLTIGQPRLFGGDPFKTEEITPTELKAWLDDTLVPVINNAEKESTVLNPSKEACQWCLVKSTCKARREMAIETAESVFAVHAKLPANVEVEEIADLLTKASTIKSYLADIELYVINQITKGIEIPGFKMVAGRTSRHWKNENNMLDFARMLGHTKANMSISKVMSPPQAEKKLGKKVTRDATFLLLIEKTPGKPTLVKESDKRKAIQFGDAETKFAEFAK